jgi:hypothetical protein
MMLAWSWDASHRVDVIAWMSRDRYRPALHWVTEVSVAAGLADLSPAVDFDQLNDVTYLDAVES